MAENDPDDVKKSDKLNNSERTGDDNNDSNFQTYKTANEYCSAVNQWLWQCYYSQYFAATLPYFLSAWQQQASSQQSTSTDVNRNITSNSAFFANNRMGNQFPFVQLNTDQSGTAVQGRTYLLPPLWKRFLAELMDFFILLILKLMVTYVAVDFFEIIDLDKYDLDILRDDKVDYRAALEMTSEIVTLEIIHRFVVCLFEGICLHRGAMGPGGATPGKSFMKLRVVRCLDVVQVDAVHIRVQPAEDIGFGWALLRSFIKNFSLAFFFPACCTIFFFQHNRAAYDMICKCIVVEEIPRNNGRH